MTARHISIDKLSPGKVRASAAESLGRPRLPQSLKWRSNGLRTQVLARHRAQACHGSHVVHSLSVETAEKVQCQLMCYSYALYVELNLSSSLFETLSFAHDSSCNAHSATCYLDAVFTAANHDELESPLCSIRYPCKMYPCFSCFFCTLSNTYRAQSVHWQSSQACIL